METLRVLADWIKPNQQEKLGKIRFCGSFGGRGKGR
jgi:hypothetical protein